MIFSIGNSHSHYFSESTDIVAPECHKQHPYFRSYSIGAAISYNFYENHLPRVKSLIRDTINPSKNDYIMLCGFLEIDARWHLPKKISQTGLSIEEVVDECVNRYFRAIKELKELDYNVIVFGSHPSTTGNHNDDPSNPVWGDCLTRNKITKTYNSKLEQLCIEENIHYIDIFDYLIDKETGLTNMNYYRDYTHLNFKSHPYMIERFKEKKLII